MNIQENNFSAQSNIIDTVREEMYETQRRMEDKKLDIVREVNSLNERLNKRLDEVVNSFE